MPQQISYPLTRLLFKWPLMPPLEPPLPPPLELLQLLLPLEYLAHRPWPSNRLPPR
jgi:hypothetical protein